MQILPCWNHAGTKLAVTFSVVTFGDTLLLLQNSLTDRMKDPAKQDTVCLFLREYLVIHQINDLIFIN